MTEYCEYNPKQKPYDDVIREVFLNSNENQMSRMYGMRQSSFGYVPNLNLGADRVSREYMKFTDGTVVTPNVAIGHKAFDVSFAQIKSFIESEPVEPGMDHPAMDYLQPMLENKADRAFLKGILSNGIESWLKADILLCLTGVDIEDHSDYLFEVAAEGLKSEALRVRDAAVQALEAISMEGVKESDAAIWLLNRQAPSEKITWLRTYVEQIVTEYHSSH